MAVQLQKGAFYKADGGSETKVVSCHFNPDLLTLTKSNTWEQKGGAAGAPKELTFSSEGLQTLTMTLIFDTYEGRKDESNTTYQARSDVRATTNLLVGLMAKSSASTGGARPPHVVFGWGNYRSFTGVITSLTQKFKLFLEDGTPVRAEVNVTLQEVVAGSSSQNPTTRPAGARRALVVRPGDSIDLLATEAFGTPAQWRTLAEANNLEDPRRLRAGQVLLIPPEA